MKYLPLIWAGLWRKRVRTVLTMLSVIVAFVLFGVMHGVTAGIDQMVNQMSNSRLRIQSRVNITEALPLAHRARIESVPGVLGVGYYNFLGTYYQEPRNQVSTGAMDIGGLRTMFPEIELSQEAVDAMAQTRDGALIGHDLAEARGWKIGDRIPLKSSVWMRKDGAPDWTFEIVGVYGSARGKVPTNELWINYGYFDEERTFGNGTVTLYFVRINEPARSGEIAEQIDGLFANSANETQTMNERDWLRGRVAQIGNMAFFVNAIIGAVMFTLLFLTGNTMMQSVRERIPELAVLKTYGFSSGAIVSLVLGEAFLLCGAAAGIGLGIARLASPSIFRAIGAGGLALPWNVIATGLGVAAVVALISAVPPAWRAQRISIVDALAGR
ncbi:MAG: ABC transporter permease [Gammaproteobacteria bacterium]